MSLEDRREPIFELAEKFQFLKESAISRDHCGHNASDNSFCGNLGIARMTLGSVNAGGLTLAQQQALAEKCGFSLSWLEWNDPKADRNTRREARRDTFEAFKKRYLEHHSKEEPKSTPPPTILVLLKEDLWAETLSAETELASLSLRTGQSKPEPGEATLGFRLELPQGFHRRSNNRRQARHSHIPLRIRSHDRRQGSDGLSGRHRLQWRKIHSS